MNVTSKTPALELYQVVRTDKNRTTLEIELVHQPLGVGIDQDVRRETSR